MVNDCSAESWFALPEAGGFKFQESCYDRAWEVVCTLVSHSRFMFLDFTICYGAQRVQIMYVADLLPLHAYQLFWGRVWGGIFMLTSYL